MMANVWRYKNARGNISSEYFIMVGIIVMAVITMTPAIKRGVQSAIKTTADHLRPQNEAEQEFDNGYLESSQSTVNAKVRRDTRERKYTTGYLFDDQTEVNTYSKTNLGFSPDN